MSARQDKASANRVGWHIIWVIATYFIVSIGFVLLNLRFGWIEREYSVLPGQQIALLAVVFVLMVRLTWGWLRVRVQRR